jgi:hypothetical protein
MKASELRIGNWVSSIYGMEFQVYPMYFKQMPTDEKHNLILSNWKPIPLTEEWLLKFGFERMKFFGTNINYLLKEPICISTSDMVVEWNKPNFIIKQIKYIHEIQNIYFALTGEELTFKSE